MNTSFRLSVIGLELELVSHSSASKVVKHLSWHQRIPLLTAMAEVANTGQANRDYGRGVQVALTLAYRWVININYSSDMRTFIN